MSNILEFKRPTSTKIIFRLPLSSSGAQAGKEKAARRASQTRRLRRSIDDPPIHEAE